LKEIYQELNELSKKEIKKDQKDITENVTNIQNTLINIEEQLKTMLLLTKHNKFEIDAKQETLKQQVTDLEQQVTDLTHMDKETDVRDSIYKQELNDLTESQDIIDKQVERIREMLEKTENKN
jgi:hypothetical protein